MKTTKETNPADTYPDTELLDSEDMSEDIVFHYSRERRLMRASPRVRALYEDANKPKPRFGLFSSLVDSKPKAIIFAAIVLICVIILLFFPDTR